MFGEKQMKNLDMHVEVYFAIPVTICATEHVVVVITIYILQSTRCY